MQIIYEISFNVLEIYHENLQFYLTFNYFIWNVLYVIYIHQLKST